MRQKVKEKEQARELRSNGCSIYEISEQLNVSKSSVSVWVRDIDLTDGQRADLRSRRISGPKPFRERATYKEVRMIARDKGREKARQNIMDKSYIAGCALYWAEGGKGRNAIRFCNTDPNMMKIFISFLRDYFDVKDERITFRIRCYFDHEYSFSNAVSFWSEVLNLPASQLQKSQCMKPNSRSRLKHEHGICYLNVNDIDIKQQIFGSIEELFGASISD